MGIFQFVVLANLRAAQLMRGCLPRVDGVHKATVIAQLEVSAGKVVQAIIVPPTTAELAAAAVEVGSTMLVPMSQA